MQSGDCNCKENYYGIYCENECIAGNLVCDSKRRCKCENGLNTIEDVVNLLINPTLNPRKEKSSLNVPENGLDLNSILLVIFIIVMFILSVLVCKYRLKSKQWKSAVSFKKQIAGNSGNESTEKEATIVIVDLPTYQSTKSKSFFSTFYTKLFKNGKQQLNLSVKDEERTESKPNDLQNRNSTSKEIASQKASHSSSDISESDYSD